MDKRKYRFSFTGASLMLPEMIELASSTINTDPEQINKADIIRGQKANTIGTQFREIRIRVEALTSSQLEILAKGDTQAQKHIALLAICKAYAFIRDFILEVLRDKVLAYDYQITEGEYATFCKRKTEDHPELEDLRESTSQKIKQVTFKVLEQTGLIDNARSKKINLQLVDQAVISAVVKDDPEWLKIYFMSDDEVLKQGL
jgi:hypothetical protein